MLKKYKKLLIIFASLVLLYTLVGFLVIPAVLESQLPKIVHDVTGRKTSVEKIEFNPYAMTLSLQGYETQEPDGPRFIGFEELYVNFEPWSSLIKMAVTLDEIRLDGFYGHIAILADNSLNFSDLLDLADTDEPEEMPEEDDGELFPLWISDLKIQDSEVEFDDFALSKPFEVRATPINLHLKNLTTVITEGSLSTLTANLISGGTLNWRGEITLNPLASSGHLNIEGLGVYKAWTFIQDLVNFEVKEGATIRLAADYRFDGSGEELQFLIPSAQLHLDGFRLSEKGQELHLIEIPGFAMDGIAFDLAKQEVTVAKVSAQDGVLKGWLSPDGVFNYQTLFNPVGMESPAESASPVTEEESAGTKAVENQPSPTAKTVSESPAQAPAEGEDQPMDSSPPQGPAENSVVNATLAAESVTEPASPGVVPPNPSPEAGDNEMPWLVTVNEVSLNNYAIHIEDRTQKEVIAINLTPVNITVLNVSTEPGAKLQVDTNITVNETGSIIVKGEAGIDPVMTQLEIAVEKIALQTFQPYLDSVSRLKLADGAVNVDGKFDFSLDKNGQPALRYAGNASVVDVHAVDARNVPAGQKDILKWKAFNINGMEFDLEPMKIHIGGVETDSAFARVIINKDGTTNLAEIFAPSEEASTAQTTTPEQPETETEKTAESPAEIPPITIGQVKINNASAFFGDLSLILPFAVRMGDLNGAVKGLSSDEKSRASVFLKGKVDKVSPVTIKGSITPFHPDNHSDIRMQFESVNLTTATPYMAQFAGYKIDKGTISLDLNYKISRRKLEANNQVIIDQLTLGEEIDSPDAVSIPVKLAIALLTDSHGTIDLELPISGSLDDPEFSIGALVGKVLLNLVKKVVLSPFTLIASLAGSDEDLSQVEFAKGRNVLSVKQKKRLDSIAKGLNERPELQLEVRGAAYEGTDWPILADTLLREQLKQRKWDELNEDGEAPATPQEIELSLGEYERLLGERFSENFPQEADTFASAQGSDDPKVSAGFYNMAKEKLIESMPVNESRMKMLAKTRAENISEYLIEQGGILHDRIFLMDLLIQQHPPQQGLATVPLTLSAS